MKTDEQNFKDFFGYPLKSGDLVLYFNLAQYKFSVGEVLNTNNLKDRFEKPELHVNDIIDNCKVSCFARHCLKSNDDQRITHFFLYKNV